MEQTKTCKICKKEKPVSEFSKSYSGRCKSCVAEQERENRARQKAKQVELSVIQEKMKMATEIAVALTSRADKYTNTRELGEKVAIITNTIYKSLTND